MSGRLAGKAALVTGAAQGLGAEIARAFAREGARVFLGDVNEGAGKETARAIAGAEFLLLDVTSEESWRSALGAVVSRAGRIDVLINNAGINIRKDIEEMDEESLDRMLAVNVKGPFLGIKHALPLMRGSGGGVILNMSSICGLIGHRYTNEAYAAAKGAVTLLTKSVAVRCAKDNIRCNSVHPSTVDTPLVRQVLQDPARRAERLGEVPLGRLAAAADVAAAFVYLASDEAAFVNGVSFPVDGGVTAD
ncbi:MAG: glucose 1-dehydrogenase [Anaerolineales bacterium]|nr:glucose 1-dehydrogenase [Anaerolineales bacterium]